MCWLPATIPGIVYVDVPVRPYWYTPMGAAFTPGWVRLMVFVVWVLFPPPLKSTSATKEASPPPELLSTGPPLAMAMKSPPELIGCVGPDTCAEAADVPNASIALTT